MDKVLQAIKNSRVIAAVKDRDFNLTLKSSVKVVFLFDANILTIVERVKSAHKEGKLLFVHVDLAEGVGKDKSGIEFLSKCGVDGVISTKSTLIKAGKDFGLATIQRFFANDTKGVNNIEEVLHNSKPDFIEILPGVINKITERFAKLNVPLIVGGLIETKKEVMDAINLGAIAVSTGKENLWNL